MKGNIYPVECRVPKNRRDKKVFLSGQCKETEENSGRERLEISSRKLEIPREYFMQNGHNKGKKQYGLTEADNIKKRRQEH